MQERATAATKVAKMVSTHRWSPLTGGHGRGEQGQSADLTTNFMELPSSQRSCHQPGGTCLGKPNTLMCGRVADGGSQLHQSCNSHMREFIFYIFVRCIVEESHKLTGAEINK